MKLKEARLLRQEKLYLRQKQVDDVVRKTQELDLAKNRLAEAEKEVQKAQERVLALEAKTSSEKAA